MKRKKLRRVSPAVLHAFELPGLMIAWAFLAPRGMKEAQRRYRFAKSISRLTCLLGRGAAQLHAGGHVDADRARLLGAQGVLDAHAAP